MIRPCTCANTYQNSLYGTGNRVWTESGAHGKTAKDTKTRCTSCGRVETLSSPKATKADAKVDRPNSDR